MIIFDNEIAYDIPIDLNTVWGINIYDHNGSEEFEVILKEFDVYTFSTDGSRAKPLTRCYSIGPTDIAAWAKGRVRA